MHQGSSVMLLFLSLKRAPSALVVVPDRSIVQIYFSLIYKMYYRVTQAQKTGAVRYRGLKVTLRRSHWSSSRRTASRERRHHTESVRPWNATRGAGRQTLEGLADICAFPSSLDGAHLHMTNALVDSILILVTCRFR
jgi:hypothetical protein